MIEECGVSPNDIHFVASLRIKWESHFTMNIIYSTLLISDLLMLCRKEEHITFEWVEVPKLSEVTFYPKSLWMRIAQWASDKKDVYFNTVQR